MKLDVELLYKAVQVGLGLLDSLERSLDLGGAWMGGYLLRFG